MVGNTVYVVTGGNRGLGLGLVKSLLARPSTTVVASVRNTDAAASLEAESKAMTLGAASVLHIMQLNFNTAMPPEKVRDIFDAAVGTSVDHVDVLINNAGCCPPLALATKTSADDFRTAFESNTIAPLMVFQAFWPLLQKAPAIPKVIMMTSSLGGIGMQEPMPGGAYGPSKAALNWITRALHLQNEGLVAVALHPGWVQTRAGEFVAKEWNFATGPPVTVDDSVKGMLEVIDGAARDNVSGKFVTQTGQILPCYDIDIRDPAAVTNTRGRPRLDAARCAENAKLRLPRSLRVDADDADAEFNATQRTQRSQARPRGPRQPSQASGRGTRPHNPSARRGLSQFEIGNAVAVALQASRGSRGNKRQRSSGAQGHHEGEGEGEGRLVRLLYRHSRPERPRK
ncbi:Short-chain dehydrogenase/reductase family oxidoreductase [Tolypocladium paradoxum]|uniref:Short-chain dehydrogenase/reductase family oxidoreductase n=1 Tax=Tolypocladium paradoxum TaxID=94208 RepID=A0A2S4KQK9_9HYPO|nr:Short-chain dehydrogenase/reductase family oxidoreductase [Tolypocladium paradoxum]